MATLEIHVVGLGVDVPATLSDSSARVIADSHCVIGWQRHEAIISPYVANNQFLLVSKLEEVDKLMTELSQSHLTDSKICSISIVASGDPLFFGIGKWLKRYENDYRLIYHPAVSCIQAACHRQGVSLQDVDVISLHGRPLESIRTQLKKNRILVVLTDQCSSPQILARECISAGFENSMLTVHENLGYEDEQSIDFCVSDLVHSSQAFSTLHVSIIEVKGKGLLTPEFPGIADHFFETGASPGKGMISKREVRLAILSYLQPANGDVIWDIGAGCGGVAVELSYWNRNVQVYAIEFHNERLKYLNQNRERFGVVQNLHIVNGKAPEALTELPLPTKIFIGGSDGELRQLLALAWKTIPAGGIIVASGVIEKTKEILTRFCVQIANSDNANVESVELSVRRGAVSNGMLNYIPKLPVEIFKVEKLEPDS